MQKHMWMVNICNRTPTGVKIDRSLSADFRFLEQFL